MTASGFDQVQVHVDRLSGKVHAVPTRATDTTAYAARIVLKMALRSGDGIPDVLVVDHDPTFTSALFGSSLIIGLAYHKNTNAKAERVNCVLGDTLRAFANGGKDEWGVWLPYADFAVNYAASTLGGDLSPFFIDRGQHPRLPLSLPGCRGATGGLRDSDEGLAAGGAGAAAHGTAGELTGFFLRIDLIFPLSTSKRYSKG